MVVVPCGSAGVKAAKVACGEADLYVQPKSAGKLWDACAPEAIVRAAGGAWVDSKGAPYSYARETLENVTGVAAGHPALVKQMVERFTSRVVE
jgi:3'(2'), 5'-bisphosphate nucleotidase